MPRVRAGRVPVIGGFIGATRDGITTTLGRGGSDYSASLLGRGAGREAIEIWTDVDGMLTADPRVVAGRASSSRRIRFDEASELASFGAKVLHPNTIAPAVRLGIPVFVYNTHNPSGTGTRITFDAPRRPVSAIAGKGPIRSSKCGRRACCSPRGFCGGCSRPSNGSGHRSTWSPRQKSPSRSRSIRPDWLDAILAELAALGDVSVERARGVVASSARDSPMTATRWRGPFRGDPGDARAHAVA